MGIGGTTFSAPFVMGCASISFDLESLGVVLGVVRSVGRPRARTAARRIGDNKILS